MSDIEALQKRRTELKKFLSEADADAEEENIIPRRGFLKLITFFLATLPCVMGCSTVPSVLEGLTSQRMGMELLPETLAFRAALDSKIEIDTDALALAYENGSINEVGEKVKERIINALTTVYNRDPQAAEGLLAPIIKRERMIITSNLDVPFLIPSMAMPDVRTRDQEGSQQTLEDVPDDSVYLSAEFVINNLAPYDNDAELSKHMDTWYTMRLLNIVRNDDAESFNYQEYFSGILSDFYRNRVLIPYANLRDFENWLDSEVTFYDRLDYAGVYDGKEMDWRRIIHDINYIKVWGPQREELPEDEVIIDEKIMLGIHARVKEWLYDQYLTPEEKARNILFDIYFVPAIKFKNPFLRYVRNHDLFNDLKLKYDVHNLLGNMPKCSWLDIEYGVFAQTFFGADPGEYPSDPDIGFKKEVFEISDSKAISIEGNKEFRGRMTRALDLMKVLLPNNFSSIKFKEIIECEDGLNGVPRVFTSSFGYISANDTYINNDKNLAFARRKKKDDMAEAYIQFVEQLTELGEEGLALIDFYKDIRMATVLVHENKHYEDQISWKFYDADPNKDSIEGEKAAHSVEITAVETVIDVLEKAYDTIQNTDDINNLVEHSQLDEHVINMLRNVNFVIVLDALKGVKENLKKAKGNHVTGEDGVYNYLDDHDYCR